MAFLRLSFLALLLFLYSCDNQTQIPDEIEQPFFEVNQEIIADGFTIPWGIEIISENEYLFTERMGELYHYLNGIAVALDGLPQSYTVTIDRLTYGGYMDVSLHPNFDTNGLVYLAYVNENGRMSVARFDFRNNTVKNVDIIFESNAFSIGSRIAWQDDEHFFVTQGMGGDPTPEPGAQNLSHHGGKIHRLMADGSIPVDNPIFEGYSEPTTIWSYGHRDPQGLYYDSDEKILYSSEHGPLGGDEINVIQKGGNYGWSLFSYGLNYDGTPVSDMTELEARRTTSLPLKYWTMYFRVAPSGLLFLKDSQFAEWNGTFIFGSLALQRLIAYDPETDETSVLMEGIGRVRDVAQLPSGALLVLIDAKSPGFFDSGRIVKLTHAG